MPRSCIFGISGQDGAYLARALLERGHDVFGTSRQAGPSACSNLRRLGLSDVPVYSLDVTDPSAVLSFFRSTPADEAYNLSGQSSAGASFSAPYETVASIVLSTAAIIDAARRLTSPPRLLFAGSGDMFGSSSTPFSEGSALSPRSPYACAKAAAFLLAENAVSAFGLYSATAILFNHESPLRDERFFSRKVVSAALSIARGGKARLSLGDLSLVRDFGWAPEYARAMSLVLSLPAPRSLVIATGRSFPLSDFVSSAFAAAGLQWRDHVDIDPSLFRPGDAPSVRANPSLAREVLGWQALYDMPVVARMMVESFSESPSSLHSSLP